MTDMATATAAIADALKLPVEDRHKWISELIDDDPLATRAALVAEKDKAQAILDARNANLSELRAASFARTISRAEYEQARADHAAWVSKHTTFMKSLGRYIIQAQDAQSERRKADKASAHELLMEVTRLRQAIGEHKRAALRDERPSSDYDLVLWGSREGTT